MCQLTFVSETDRILPKAVTEQDTEASPVQATAVKLLTDTRSDERSSNFNKSIFYRYNLTAHWKRVPVK